MSVIRRILLVISGLVLGGMVGGFFSDYLPPIGCRAAPCGYVGSPVEAGSAITTCVATAAASGVACAMARLEYGVAIGALIGAFLLPIAVMILTSLFGRHKGNASPNPPE